MGLFSSLFGKPVILEDEVFGALQFATPNKGEAGSYFSSNSVFFGPAGRTIYCSIEADLIGPTPAQQGFFRYVEENYAALIKDIIPHIEGEFQNWKPDFKVKDFEAEFWLVGMNIPRLDEELAEWEWSFETVHDANHTLTVHMHDDIPQGIHFDG